MQNFIRLEVTDFIDKEFIILILEIENCYKSLSKFNQIRVESWVKIDFSYNLKSLKV